MEDFSKAIGTDWNITTPFLVLYLATTTVDVLFGLAVAFTTKVLCSTISRAGIMRKLMMVGTVLLAATFDGVLPEIEATIMGLNLRLTFAALTCVWWMVHELLSITEHGAILGMPMPRRLKDALAVVHNAIDKTEEGAAQPPAPATPALPADEPPPLQQQV